MSVSTEKVCSDVTLLVFSRRIQISSRTPVLLSEIFHGFPEMLVVNVWTVPSDRLCHDCVFSVCFHIHQKREHPEAK
jgi:hypothetical protein